MSAQKIVDSALAFGHHKFMRYRVIIEQDEDGVFVAECPTLPGCVSQGATRDEAVVNIKDAIEGYIASLEKHGEAMPPR
jgi:predicted RNase H-like HicB family nuclease